MLSVFETVNLAYHLHRMTTGENNTTMSIENVLQSLALSHVANSKVISFTFRIMACSFYICTGRRCQ